MRARALPGTTGPKQTLPLWSCRVRYDCITHISQPDSGWPVLILHTFHGAPLKIKLDPR
jgi:hypothetical protein